MLLAHVPCLCLKCPAVCPTTRSCSSAAPCLVFCRCSVCSYNHQRLLLVRYEQSIIYIFFKNLVFQLNSPPNYKLGRTTNYSENRETPMVVMIMRSDCCSDQRVQPLQCRGRPSPAARPVLSINCASLASTVNINSNNTTGDRIL